MSGTGPLPPKSGGGTFERWAAQQLDLNITFTSLGDALSRSLHWPTQESSLTGGSLKKGSRIGAAEGAASCHSALESLIGEMARDPGRDSRY
jgi:hypothetical protein